MKASTWFSAVALLTVVGGASLAEVPTQNRTTATSIYDQFPGCAHPCAEQSIQDMGCSDDDQGCICQAVLSQEMAECLKKSCSFKNGLITKNQTVRACDVPLRERPSALLSTASIVLGSVSLTCIGLRLMARPPARKKWTEMADDWVMVLNGVVVGGFTVIGVLLHEEGFGKDLHTLKLREITVSQKLLYAHEVTYSVSIMLTRISILLFYLRVFPFTVVPVLKRVIYAALAASLATGIAIIMALALQCLPISYNWDWWEEGSHGHCLELKAVGYSSGAIGIVLDIWIMLIPLPEIRKLRLPLKQKLGVILVFIAWGGVMAVSIPRMVWMKQFYESKNPTWHVFYATFWSACEVYASVICACLPRIYMLFTMWYRKRFPADPDRTVHRIPELAHISTRRRSSVEPPLTVTETEKASGEINPVSSPSRAVMADRKEPV